MTSHLERYADRYLGQQPKPRRWDRRSDFGHHLRGAAHQGERQRALRGSKLGAASPGRRLSDDERLAVEARLLREGVLSAPAR